MYVFLNIFLITFALDIIGIAVSILANNSTVALALCLFAFVLGIFLPIKFSEDKKQTFFTIICNPCVYISLSFIVIFVLSIGLVSDATNSYNGIMQIFKDYFYIK